MIELLTIIGARPQIIKAAAVSRAVHGKYKDEIRETILHTGQHYDREMSEVFFEELSIPKPDFNLGVGSCSHGEQTARMISGIEPLLQTGKFDAVLVYGDTNSTLAGALAASKLRIPVFHVEAGLRSYDMSMPEELNRTLCDRLSSLMFAPTRRAVENLSREGLPDLKFRFLNGKGQKLVLSGDVMLDNVLFFSELASRRSDVLSGNGLNSGEYILATVHRDMNTDNPARLNSIFRALADVAAEDGRNVIIPLHPRTRKMLSHSLEPDVRKKLESGLRLIVAEPASYLDMIELERNASLVVTDSGGVQKESFLLGRPVVVLRTETEWTEIPGSGAACLADADYYKIRKACSDLAGRTLSPGMLFGNGHAAELICAEIVDYLS